MGIDAINPFLRKQCPHVFIKRSLMEFSGKRVAFDANNWMFRKMTISHRKVVDSTDVCTQDPDRDAITKVWISDMMDSVATFIAYGITPVFVFDGVYPEKKAATKAERKKVKDDIKDRITAMREAMASGDILLRTSAAVEELRKLVRQVFYVTKIEEELFRSLLVGLGLPCVQAAGEAEQLCTMLCLDGKVTAVYSADTDNLAYGCPFLIQELLDEYVTDPKTKQRYRVAMTVKIEDILRGLGMTQTQFVDFCIMLGCDYNQSIPQVGGARAYNLIKKFGSIDGIPRILSSPNLIAREACACGLPKTSKQQELVYDINLLEHQFCRAQFGAVTNGSLRGQLEQEVENNHLDVNTETLKTNGRELLAQYSLIRLWGRLMDLYAALPPPNDTVTPASTSPQRLPAKPQVRLVLDAPQERPSLNFELPAPVPAPVKKPVPKLVVVSQ